MDWLPVAYELHTDPNDYRIQGPDAPHIDNFGSDLGLLTKEIGTVVSSGQKSAKHLITGFQYKKVGLRPFCCRMLYTVLGIRIRLFLGLQDQDPDP